MKAHKSVANHGVGWVWMNPPPHAPSNTVQNHHIELTKYCFAFFKKTSLLHTVQKNTRFWKMNFPDPEPNKGTSDPPECLVGWVGD